MTRVLLLTPPLIDFNAPYPATAYLAGFLGTRSIPVAQADLSLELACRVFSSTFLRKVRDQVEGSLADRAGHRALSPSTQFFLERFEDYEGTVDAVVRFLQGRDSALAHRIASRRFCPEGPRFLRFERRGALERAYGSLGIQDRAKCLATTFLVDIVDVIQRSVDSEFCLSRYSSSAGDGYGTFDRLQRRLERRRTLVDDELAEALVTILARERPDLVGLTVPFADNLPYALRCAQIIRAELPSARIVIGGGYVNTQLRHLDEPRLFDFVDYVCLDAGERPLECLVEHLEGRRPQEALHRTFVRRDDRVAFLVQPGEPEVAQQDTGYPTYKGLDFGRYLSFVNAMNPGDGIFFDLRAHKLTLAHGCYWKQCTFCDVHLDYIRRFDPSPVALTVDRMRRLQQETGQSAFHFVDEAAPPAVLRRLSEALLAERMHVSWWTNVRFEKTFTPELANLMAAAGCLAVSGGLEVASDRLLALIRKGVTVEQVARVSRAFSLAGIVVHAYLIYGFPTETEQETIDSLEYVRQMFKAGCLQSAVWHRFSATLHSPIAAKPADFGIRLDTDDQPAFDQYLVRFHDPTGTNHDRLGAGLEHAVNCFREGVGLDADLQSWFDHAVPATTVDPGFIAGTVADMAPTGPPGRPGLGTGWAPAARTDGASNGPAAVEVGQEVWSSAHNGSTLLMNVETGRVVALNASAASMWDRLSRGWSRHAIVESLVQSYDADSTDLHRDLDALVRSLSARRFVRTKG